VRGAIIITVTRILLLYTFILLAYIFLFHVMFYPVLTCLLMCKSPDILHHSRSCFLTTPNLYVQIPELGTKRLSRQRKTWSISRSSRSSCSEARVRHRSIFPVPEHLLSSPEQPAFGADLRSSRFLVSGSFCSPAVPSGGISVRLPAVSSFVLSCIFFLYEHQSCNSADVI
jgi:hypothetical protein